MVDNIELGTLTSSGWDTSGAPVASSPNTYTAASSPTVTSDSTIGVRPGDYWLESNGNIWINRSNAAGAAVWAFVPRTWQGNGAALTGDTAETAAATVTIPANAMGLNGRLTFDAAWLYTNSANDKTPRVRFGNGLSGTVFRGGTAQTTTTNYRDFSYIQNQGATNDQVGGPAGPSALWNTSTNTFVDGTIDTTAAQTLVFSGQLEDAGESIRLQAYTVTLTRPDIGA
jgi:hypothetical protein